jgi:hypothetical protein
MLPTRIARDATSVYWTNNASPGSVVGTPLGGGGATPIAIGQTAPYPIAIDATSVYWAANGAVLKATPK